MNQERNLFRSSENFLTWLLLKFALSIFSLGLVINQHSSPLFPSRVVRRV